MNVQPLVDLVNDSIRLEGALIPSGIKIICDEDQAWRLEYLTGAMLNARIVYASSFEKLMEAVKKEALV